MIAETTENNQSGVSSGDELHPHRTIAAIAFPAILANSSAPLAGLIDTWAIGHLPHPGYLAAVGLGSVIFNYILWAFGFLRMGTTGMIAQAKGKQDDALLIAGIWRSIALAIALGVGLLILQDLLWVLALKALAPPESVAELTNSYFKIRIWGSPAALLIYAVSGVFFGLAKIWAVVAQQLLLNISNAGLNVLFVVGLGMGVSGVALGTVIAQWIAAILGLWLLVRLIGYSTLKAGLHQRQTWLLAGFRNLIAINGFIFIRTIMLMTALSLIMRIAGSLGTVEMAASHVVMQYLLLISLGLDGFAHATEAKAGAAWGQGRQQPFRRWVRLTALWAVIASLFYAVGFWLLGGAITNVLTDISEVRLTVASLMPLVIALPLVAVACYQFDGVYIAATAGSAMMGTMAVAFAAYLLVLEPMTARYGLMGLWGSVLVFMAVRGLAQGVWYPRLARQLVD